MIVAHSLGGFTGTLVCARAPVGLPRVRNRRRDRHGTDDEIVTFLHDVEPDLAAEALAKGRDQSGTPMTEPWPLEAWPDVPTS